MLEHFCGRCRSLLHKAASGAEVPLKDMCGRCRTQLRDTARKAVKGSVIPAALATFIVAGVTPPASAAAGQAGSPPTGTVAFEFPAGQAHPRMMVPLAELVPPQDRSESPHPVEPEPTMDGPASLYAATAATSPRSTRVQPPSSGGAAPTT